ncbi:MAG TPA: macro domain-containing protein [Anaerolineales bacterium]|nr:macro domain-containing protein [Anaerolineales bacterium]
MAMNKYAGKKCFVIMPFGKKKDIDGYEVDFDHVYHELIYKAVKELGVDCERCDEIIDMGAIHKKMFRGIFDADLSVVDITSLNPNVFYELGVRHALHRYGTLVIRRNSNLPIPFNINGLNILGYDIDSTDQLESHRKKIRDHIQKSLDTQGIDSIIYDALDDLKVERRAKLIGAREEKLYPVLGVPDKQIGYITGNINNINNVDVWVNSENTNMQMARPYEFSISGTIRYEGATKDANGYVVDDLIAKDLRKVTKGRDSSPGNIVVTTSGELENSNNVKRIFHAAAVVCEPGSGYRPITNIAQCVRNALRKADSAELAALELDSILFPLMGTGTTRSSAQEMADKLIDAAIEYVKQNPQSRINRIYFLAYTEQDREICRHKFNIDSRIATLGETLA